MSSETLRQAAARLSSGRTSTTVDLESQQPSSSSYSSASPFDFFSHIGTSISSGVSGGVGGWFSTNKDQEEEQISYFSGMFTLTRQQRMYGFVMCLALGLLCIFIACMMLPSILITSRKFAFLYTTGNMLLVLSTMFFMGPYQQLQTMFNSERWIPSTAYLASMLLTFFVALKVGNIVLVMMLIFVQLIAMGWYILTYIPFGMQIVSGVFSAARRLVS